MRWGSENDPVTCISCGVSIERSDAREYDKHGDRWDREGKEFEYLCSPVSATSRSTRDRTRGGPRGRGAGQVSDEEFVTRFLTEREERPGRE